MSDAIRSTAVNPFMDPRSACDNAAIVALVEIEGSDEQWVTARVLRAFRAPVETPAVIKVIQGMWNPAVGDSFYLFVSEYQDALYVTRDEREVVRLLAGLPSRELQPDSVRLIELYESADAVVHGTLYATSSDSGSLRVNTVDKGDLQAGDRPDVVVGYHTEEAGGPWTFETDTYVTSHGFDGWFFLRREDGGLWSVQNVTHPTRTTTLDLRTIHELRPDGRRGGDGRSPTAE